MRHSLLLFLCWKCMLMVRHAPGADGNLLSTLYEITRWRSDADDLSHLTSYAAHSVRQAFHSYLHTIRTNDFGRHVIASLAAVGSSRDITRLFVRAVPSYIPTVDESYTASCSAGVVDGRQRTLQGWQRCLCGMRGAIGHFRYGLRNLTTLERGRLAAYRHADGDSDDELCRRASVVSPTPSHADGNHVATYCVMLRASRALRELDTKLMTLLRLTRSTECTYGVLLGPGPTWHYPQPFQASLFAAVFHNLLSQLDSVQRHLSAFGRN